MKLCLAFTCILVASAQAEVCKTTTGATCMAKAQVASGYHQFFQPEGADPCFVFGGPRVCFISAGSLGQCECGISACNCGGIPGCDFTYTPSNCSGDQQTYCDLYSAHTLCEFCNVNMTSCGKVCGRGITNQADIDTIINKHNELRRKVAKGEESQGLDGNQPPAQDMYELSWDPELAKAAQMWADQCPLGHDENKARQSPTFKSVGQNMAGGSSSVAYPSFDYAKYIEAWYSEVSRMKSAYFNAYPEENLPKDQEIGHYTQVVYGKTTKVGCGAISYYKDGWYSQKFVCNYGVAGNLIGTPTYTKGTTAALCKASNDGLCTGAP